MKKKSFVIVCLLIIFLLSAIVTDAADNYQVESRNPEIHLSHIMKALEHNYHITEKLSHSPLKNVVKLKNRVAFMKINLENIKSLNENDKVDAKLIKLEDHINELELAVDRNNVARMRQLFGDIFMSCFKCHETHRKFH